MLSEHNSFAPSFVVLPSYFDYMVTNVTVPGMNFIVKLDRKLKLSSQKHLLSLAIIFVTTWNEAIKKLNAFP